MEFNGILEDYATYIYRGKQPKYSTNGIPVINQKAIQWSGLNKEFLKFHNNEIKVDSRHFVKKNDLLINSTGTGTVGRVYHFKFQPEKMFVDSHITIIRTDENKLRSRFLYYQMRTNKFQNMILNEFLAGSTGQVEFNKSMVKKLPISIPKINYQDVVIKVLDELEDKIEINKKIIANLEELSQTLFKRWFVDFEFPDEDGNPYKSSGGEMVSSELGKIPENWRIKTINNLLTINSGYAFKSKWWSDIGYDVIKIKDINNNSIDINNLDKVNKDYINKAANFKVWGGEIVIALTGATAGKMGIVPKLKEVAFVNQRVGLVNSEINNVYIYNLLRSDRLRRLTLEEAIGSAQPNISPVKFGNIKVVCPSKKIINQYCQLLKHSYQKIVELYGENNYLIQLRDTLLPKLMSGELEIPDDVEVDNDEFSI